MAIIVVLAAIAIPTFGRQLETARESNDAEAIRAAATDAYSKVYTAYATTGNAEEDDLTDDTLSVTLTQQEQGFQYVNPVIAIGSTKVTLDEDTKFTSGTYTKNSSADLEFVFEEDSDNNGLKIKSISIGSGTAVTATSGG